MISIGLYGGMANNMYVLTKALKNNDINAKLIRDVTDMYPISQPVWEDVEIMIEYSKLENFNFNRLFWDEKEKELDWKKPDYIVDIRDANYHSDNRNKNKMKTNHTVFDKIWIRKWYGNMLDTQPYWKSIIRMMKMFDYLIVCGIEGEMLAYLSGQTYMIIPHGGDIRIAGNVNSKKFFLKRDKQLYYQYRCVKKSFQKAKYLGTHDPSGIYGINYPFQNFFFNKELKHIAIPCGYRTDMFSDKILNRGEVIKKYLPNYDGESKYTVFIPSRVDFFWKKQDWLLEIAGEFQEFNFIFSGWGKDYKKASSIVSKHNLSSNVSFLNVLLSKPCLKELMSVCDLIVDQFYLGTYGTAAVEAMALSLPIMMYIDKEVFSKRGWEAPPVINVSSKKEMRSKFRDISNGLISLKQVGSQCKKWCSRVHDENLVVENILQNFQQLGEGL